MERFSLRMARFAVPGALVSLGCGGNAEGQTPRNTNVGDAAVPSNGGAGGSGGVGMGASGGTAGASGVSGGSGTAGSSGAGTGGTSSGIRSGVPETKSANQLSAGDVQDLCAAELAYLQSQISDQQLESFGCFLLAAASGGVAPPTVADCKSFMQTCLSGGPGTTTTNCTVDQAKLAACPATVGEMEACLTAGIDMLATTLPDLNCDLFSSPADAQARLASLNQLPPACAPVEQKCPGALSPPGG